MSAGTAPSRGTPTARRRRVKRWLAPAFAAVVLGVLLTQAHRIDWEQAWRALRSYSPGTVLAALALATASHALYGCFDLLGKRYVGHEVRSLRTWATAVAAYAFTLNLGSLLGGVGMRARLYTSAGLDEATVAKLVGFSMATNWIGYALLGGCLFAAGAVWPPRQSHLDWPTFRALGALLVALAIGYVAACFRWHGRVWRWRGHRIELPSGRLALVQLAASTLNWTLMAGAMYLLLGGRVPYGTTLAVLMLASIAGVLMPIPAGLGVLEAVYLGLLSGRMGQGGVLAAVLAYRALYYLLPLAGGVALYLALERGGARRAERPREA